MLNVLVFSQGLREEERKKKEEGVWDKNRHIRFLLFWVCFFCCRGGGVFGSCFSPKLCLHYQRVLLGVLVLFCFQNQDTNLHCFFFYDSCVFVQPSFQTKSFNLLPSFLLFSSLPLPLQILSLFYTIPFQNPNCLHCLSKYMLFCFGSIILFYLLQ